MKVHGFILLFFINTIATAQLPKIHAHNDYEKPQPLTHALEQRAFSIEADVYLYNQQLVVVHDKKDLAIAPALEALYLQPLRLLYKKHNGFVTANKDYAPVLMIDCKENFEAVAEELIRLTTPYPEVFDRSKNAAAIQLVISGDRGPVTHWVLYPSNIYFDGRPSELYDSATLQRVAFISDNYSNYITTTDSISRIKNLSDKVHAMHKLLRLWAIPDNENQWNILYSNGVDIINTDKVAACREYFLK